MGEQPWLKYINCPCCGERIAIDIWVNINSIEKADEKPVSEVEKEIINPNRLTNDEQELIDYSKKNGVFDIFLSVVKTVKFNEMPINMEKYFITFLKTSSQKMIPEFALKIFYREFGGQISFYASQGIGVVISDGVIKMFIPTQIVGGKKVRGIMTNRKINLSADEGKVEEFIKTRYGLVGGKGAMFEMMRNKSIGGFCLPDFNKYTT